MTFAELDIAPRTRGRAPAAITATVIREVTEADLALLASQRGSVPKPLVGELRERHHALARVLAEGMTDSAASAVTGYSLSRISILKHDPAFIELLAHYRAVENSLAADFAARMGQLSLTAADALLDKLENEPDKVSDALKLQIMNATADRTGFAPVQKSLNINANVDLGNRLREARRRIAASAPTVVSVESIEDASGGATSGET